MRNAKRLLDHGFTSAYSAATSNLRLDIVIRNEINAGRLPGSRPRTRGTGATGTDQAAACRPFRAAGRVKRLSNGLCYRPFHEQWRPQQLRQSISSCMRRQNTRCFVQAPDTGPWSKDALVSSTSFETVELALPDIAEKAVSSLIKTQGIGDLYRLYAIAKRDRIDYNYIDIPTDFTVEARSPFDSRFMRALYAKGYEMGRNGVPWKKAPPGFLR
jgi:hypothetical protein